jgi:hypothetical protein
MLLSTNEEDVDPEVWIMMKEQKKVAAVHI